MLVRVHVYIQTYICTRRSEVTLNPKPCTYYHYCGHHWWFVSVTVAMTMVKSITTFTIVMVAVVNVVSYPYQNCHYSD